MEASDAPEQRRPVITDLSTGDATTYELLTPSGEHLDAAKVYPAEDGLWVFTWDNELFRWDGDGMGAKLDMGGEHFNRTQFGDLIGVLSDQDDGSRVVDLVRLDGDEASVVFRRPAPDAVEVHPTTDGGVHVIDPVGTLTTYGPTGEVVGTIETEVERVGFIAVDPASGNLALVAGPEELVIVDPARGVLDRSPDVGLISTLGFGRDGEVIALTLRDGTVRLWDVAQGQYAGLVWSGSGQASTASPSWYDEATDTMWVASSGKYLGISLDPSGWVERACDLVNRDLTQDEWDRFVPGDAPPQPACA